MVEERYEVTYDGLIYDIYDNEIKEYVSNPIFTVKEHYEVVCDLLNQQDAKIKELEEQNKNIEYARQLSYKSLLVVEDDYKKLKEENKEQCNNQYFDKIQYLKNFSQDFVRMLQEHLKLVSVGSVAYFMADKDDVIDSLNECLKMYEDKESKNDKK